MYQKDWANFSTFPQFHVAKFSNNDRKIWQFSVKCMKCINQATGKQIQYRCSEALDVIKMDHVSLLVLEANGHRGTVTAEGNVVGTASKTNCCVDKKVLQHRLTCFADALRSFVDVGHSDHMECYIANDTPRDLSTDYYRYQLFVTGLSWQIHLWSAKVCLYIVSACDLSSSS